MSDLYSHIAMQKKFQDKELPTVVKKGISALFGRNVDNRETRKILAESLAYKSKEARDRILQKIGLGYDDRVKFEQEYFGVNKISTEELRKSQKAAVKKIKLNIKMSNMSINNYDDDYSKLIGQRVGSQGKVRRSFYQSSQKEYQHMATNSPSLHSSHIGGQKKSSNLSVHSSSSLSVSKNANKVAGGFGAKDSANPGVGRVGVIRVTRIGKL